MEMTPTTLSLQRPHFHLLSSSFINNDATTTLFMRKTSNCLISMKSRNRRGQKQRGGLNCECMFGLGVPEIVVIVGVATLLFGPKKLPEFGRGIGQTVKSFQQAAKEFESELRKESEISVEPVVEERTVLKKEEK
ncbi:hypothetical protein GIB67_025551 [Kingdonia uniflora]|uniref:Sec-independent protein translocase protein TatA n=1 Tax=Kingdonia uniflora TaxID=39325 RepID=A0A7J7M0G5_9MAGN|nr:hypothetical protein GIB67_025551 [Kingdonia uniflora]